MSPTALAFDVFGTVVDWRSSIIRELEEFGRTHGVQQDWPAFAHSWRAGYAPAMDRVRRGDVPWTRIDDLHRVILVDLLASAGIAAGDEDIDELNRAWHRLDPWPDTVAGLRAGLPWDCVISAELFHHYKPDPQAYLGCADLLGVPPEQLMLVAAHPSDLRAARDAGLRTAFVARPLEFGPTQRPHGIDDGEFDVTATDFLDLADKLGA